MRGARRRVKERARTRNVRLSQSQQAGNSPSFRRILVLISAILILIAAGIGLYLAWENLFSPGPVEII